MLKYILKILKVVTFMCIFHYNLINEKTESLVVHADNPGTWKAETQGFKANTGYIIRPCITVDASAPE